MGMTAYISLNFFSSVFNVDTFLGIFLQGLVSGIIGIVLGVLVLLVFKNKELLDIIKALSHKFSSKNVVAPEQGEL
jgi:hypothetical protein